MNNIYVDELPKCCEQCKINCLKKQNNVSCFIADCDGCIGGRPKNCPLKLLSKRLAEERKKVVQEIREPIIKSLENGVVRKNPKSSNTNLRDIILFQMLDILDQIEGR